MAVAKGLKVVGYFDCAGGGQVVVRNNVAYVGHVKPPNGTSIIDVSDPAKPRELAKIKVPEGTLSHKVRVENGVMLVNREVFPIGRIDPDFKGGLEVFDVSNPSKPTRITTWASRGMHRFTFDGRYVYGSPELDGYLGNVVSIIDFQNPAKPQEVGRWWMPGQWTAGGEKPAWKGTAHRCHHPMRVGNRLYASYWHGGFVILNIDDITKPKFVSGLDWSPPFPWPTHTALPVPFPLRGRQVMLVADEDVVRLPGPRHRPSCGWWTSPTRRADSLRKLPGGRGRRHRRSRTTPACTSSVRTSAAPKFRSRGSRTDCASSTSQIRMRRRKSRHSCRTSRTAPSACKATTCASTTGD